METVAAVLVLRPVEEHCRTWWRLILDEVNHYGVRSQTLSFLEPEDDIGSLEVGLGRQVDDYGFHYTLPSQSQGEQTSEGVTP